MGRIDSGDTGFDDGSEALRPPGGGIGPEEFSLYHAPVLEADEARHGLILRIIGRADAARPEEFLYWSFGAPGQCAVKVPRHSIVLGSPDETQCRRLAEITAQLDYPGVIGPEATAPWFTDRAMQLGLTFLDPEQQQILAISERPRYPRSSGHPRVATSEDTTLFVDWMIEFCREAVPNDPPPEREALERAAGDDSCLFWVDNGQPVSMARMVRPLKKSAAISGVYTPSDRRGRGYAGSVTAAMVERIRSLGKATACLYVDLNNPFSTRCYAKVGFRPVCTSLHYHKR